MGTHLYDESLSSPVLSRSEIVADTRALHLSNEFYGSTLLFVGCIDVGHGYL